jgi:hypothetical protein
MMFGGAKAWSQRTVKPKPCKVCRCVFNPVSGGNVYCPDCVQEVKRENHARAQREWRAKNPKKHADAKADSDLKRYGMNLAGYNAMLHSQRGACGICGTTDPRGKGVTRKFAVDHCHASGRVRALLCHRCNGALGMVGDNQETLSKMIKYLKDHSDE